MTKEKLVNLINNEGLTIEDFIDEIIDRNAIIGVGLISLGDYLKSYCYNNKEERIIRKKSQNENRGN